ncbi:MAG: sulfatase-like hydrolase/transferase, partial [Planctomycetota bacterium]
IDPDDMPGPAAVPCGPPDFSGKPARLAAQWHGLNLDTATTHDVRRVQATYRSMIEMVDAQIGRVLADLGRRGWRENTIVLFCSDHGDFMGDYGLIGKTVALYENLLRVPMILSGPGVPQNSRCTAHVDLTDVAPALLELAGIPALPAAQGRSFVGAFGDPEAVHRRYVVAEHAYGRAEGMPPAQIDAQIRDRATLRAKHGEAWFLDALRGRTESIHDTRTGIKLIRHDTDADELYDLNHDPGELFNRADDPELSREKVRLNKKLDQLDWTDRDIVERLR